MTGERVLVAGIGNVFLGDDGFGVAVLARLDPARIPPEVDVVDYGIRGVHLAYELLAGRYHTVIMVDAVPLGQPPGTLAVLEVPPESVPAEASVVNGHGMTPQAVLALMRSLGGTLPRVLVVGCQPGELGESMALSGPVAAALEPAARVLVDLLAELLTGAEVGARA